VGATLDLASALTDQAERHAGDLAADYTYLQPAQPSTIGHLLLAHVEPAIRDAGRLRAVHAWLDLSVAGAGGSAGSRWPLDRERLARLLGCSGVMRHAKDAMWQADGYLELAGAIATGLTHRAQLGQDLEIQASREFGQVSLADAHSRASALMPQKRNPYALAVMRASSGTAAGDLAALHVGLHSGSARTDHFHLLNGAIPRMLEEATAATRLSAAVAAGLTFHPEPAAEAAREGFVTAADVADVVAQTAGLDYRSAHKLVGRAVRALVDEGLPPDALTPERLAQAGRDALDVEVEVPADALAEALDPLACLATRRQTGSAAPAEIAAMTADARERIAAERSWVEERSAGHAASEGDLLVLASRVAGRA
jgi:argininosuccinate lyase